MIGHHPFTSVRRTALASLAVFATAGILSAAPPQGASMSYREAVSFLKEHTSVVELSDGQDGRVAICPQWQGRVMTSTCAGPQGTSFGFIHREFIEAAKQNPHFNNYGGEDRLWLSPEGGPFSLWFKPGAPQDLAHWFTPPALNEGTWPVAGTATAQQVRMCCPMKLQNASATTFDLEVDREVRLLAEGDLGALFGPVAAKMIGEPGVRKIGYETVNTVINRGSPMAKEQGLVSIWILGMLNSGPETVIIVPYQPGSEADRGPVVKSDYFGPVPADRLKVTPAAILFRGDAQYRSKIGTSQRRAKNVLGSIDFQQPALTLVQFTMPEDPRQVDYLNNMWGIPQPHPYTGDVANSYNDGPPAPGQKGLGPFYEIESLSPAPALDRGGKLTHRHRTVHITAKLPALARIAKEALGVDLNAVRREMLK